MAQGEATTPKNSPMRKAPSNAFCFGKFSPDGTGPLTTNLRGFRSQGLEVFDRQLQMLGPDADLRGAPWNTRDRGAIRQACCLSCGARFAREAIQDWLATTNPGFTGHDASASVLPDGDAALEDAAYAGFNVPACSNCMGILKPDVVFFGDNVPRERVQAALQAVEQAAALLVVGSSLMVYSGYRFAERVHQLGKPVVAINQGVTRADELLSLKIDADCGATLEQLVRDLARYPPA